MSPSSVDVTELSRMSQSLCRQAGDLVLALREEATRTASSKSSPTDVVTIADRQAEELLVESILRARPDDGIKGEEHADIDGTSGVDWHLDPIDGTTNFVYGIASYSVSIGVAIDDRMAVGSVFNPVSKELFTAVRGAGAAVNGVPLSVTDPETLATSLIGTGFSYDAARRSTQARLLVDLLPRVRDIRRFGSAALDLCSVAAGRIDGYYEQGLNRWDYAAGLLIAEEAGAVSSNLEGDAADGTWLIAAAPSILESLRGILAASDDGAPTGNG